MDAGEAESSAILQSIWAGIDVDNLICCHCNHRIPPEEGLARTFSLESLMPSDRSCAQRLDVPTLSETITIYHRHFKCLFESVQYAAISHVWHPGVAELQYRRSEANASVISVAQVVQETPVKICLGLAKDDRPCEVWHDYISVPQWLSQIKGRIIQRIPQIYGKATMTVAYLADGEPRNADSMRHGTSSHEVCRAVSAFCNSKWFSLVWTAMEYTQSNELRTMLKDYTLLPRKSANTPLLPELTTTWRKQSIEIGSHHATEKMVGMGYNLVPWQLGALEVVRTQNLRGLHTTFGNAYELLASRCVTIPRDFFHGLLGILQIDLTEPELNQDMTIALSQVAQKCILRGDYSPLMMVPASSLLDLSDTDAQSYGYLDLIPYALGEEKHPPKFSEPVSESENITMTVENLGRVTFIQRLLGSQGSMATLAPLFKLIISYSGSSLHAFVKTLARLYCLQFDAVIQRLETLGLCGQFEALLKTACSSGFHFADEEVNWIADAVGLTNRSSPSAVVTPLGYLNAHGGSLHLGDASAVVDVKCQICSEHFLLRIAMFRNEQHFSQAQAYRIPGLEYHFSLPGGAGVVVKDKQIVGRFVWGVPTCECDLTERVEVALNDLPLPKPNRFDYGSSKEKEWRPINVQKRISLS
ncbi:hypothetical protein PGQ11_013196 [Apiospora arundinis]|uniref:Heterokaryon incompatibility domain-containing protein n=1 Tax=Apiospora arundinis TaxID=335852 RepID=A0ABR2I4F8_9PEZI